MLLGPCAACFVGSQAVEGLFFFFFFLWVREVALRPTHEQASVDRCPITRHDLFSRTLPTVTCRNLV